ncbi:MAG: RelA/SpoT family protein [Chloroflexota bacterium]|nr:(p)ppGpp synthetase [Rickettsiales bacterium]MEC8712947.1 RelA/SpoT family protein [Chloroflexota bacterium]|tara:strand:+ start:364 stop:2283 length:1920 start_codon:yes stop_codon:yes gene_type:complete
MTTLNESNTKLITKVKEYLSDKDVKKINEAYKFAEKCHSGQLRKTGDPYIIHPVFTAIYLSNMKMDWETISAALLHDVIEDCGVTFEEIEKLFGRDVAGLVDGVTKLPTLKISSKNTNFSTNNEISRAATIRKLLISTSEDARVILIKLADRLHNMETLHALDEESILRISQETMEIFAPLAHRLGIWDFKWKLEDESFKYLFPKSYKEIANLISSKRKEREKYATRVTRMLEEALAKSSIQCLVEGRVKHLYSIFKKIEKYSNLGKRFDEIHDLIALRIVVNTKQDCYLALGALHELWKPIPGEFDDYIANPKESMYQSIHSTVMCLDSYPVEIQIRTKEMHNTAEMGIAAHWQYKDGADEDGGYLNKLNWFRNLIDWQIELPEDENYIDSVKTDLSKERIYCYTPAGDIKSIPEGSTPIDFAYEVHTELGNEVNSALINGQTVPLNATISNGDLVEIIKSNSPQGPKLEWLNTDLGFVTTSKSRFKIRQWFRKEEKNLSIERGKGVVLSLVDKLKIDLPLEEIASKLKYKNLDELLLHIGSGSLNSPKLVKKLTTLINYGERKNISLKINSDDRVGLIRDVTEIISKEGLNIISISTNDINTGKSILIEVDSNGLEQQNKIYSIIETIDGVNSIDTI